MMGKGQKKTSKATVTLDCEGIINPKELSQTWPYAIKVLHKVHGES